MLGKVKQRYASKSLTKSGQFNITQNNSNDFLTNKVKNVSVSEIVKMVISQQIPNKLQRLKNGIIYKQ